jgi:hypothetical protein
VIEAHLGDPSKLAPPDAIAHIDDVEKFQIALDIEATNDALEHINTFIHDAVIVEWTPADRAAVTAWAGAMLDKANNVPDIVVPDQPKVLGKPHVPAKAIEGEHQVCSLCEIVIKPASPDDEPFQTTDYVGTTCSGKPSTVAHRYPETKAAKKQAAKKIVSQPKPKAGKKKAKR